MKSCNHSTLQWLLSVPHAGWGENSTHTASSLCSLNDADEDYLLHTRALCSRDQTFFAPPLN